LPLANPPLTNLLPQTHLNITNIGIKNVAAFAAFAAFFADSADCSLGNAIDDHLLQLQYF